MAVLDKHTKYGDSYRPGDMYWGLGIELETYIELIGGAIFSAKSLKTPQQPERYSVNYWNTYKKDVIKNVFEKWIKNMPAHEDQIIQLPLLMNGHSFTKTDAFCEPEKTHAKNPLKNSKYCGTSLLDELCKIDKTVFQDGKKKWWTFDGDTVEFMTTNFYNATIEDVVGELLHNKYKWMAALQKGLDAIPEKHNVFQRRVAWPKKNYGLALFLTNRQHLGIFNNGTYHINITLPTYLDKDAKIANKALFEEQHMQVARLFQWLTPFFIARFGSPDIFSSLVGYNSAFPRGSQRGCASRYIGLGTFDTTKPLSGKQLLLPNVSVAGSWYEQIYEKPECAYVRLPEIGFDINYNKHWNHGLEFRIFDWFPEHELMDLMRFIVWMCDNALVRKMIPAPQTNTYWNTCVANAVWKGRAYTMDIDCARVFSNIINGNDTLFQESMSLCDAYNVIWNVWKKKYTLNPGPCSSRMIRVQPSLCEGPAPYLHIIDDGSSDSSSASSSDSSSASSFTCTPIKPSAPTVHSSSSCCCY